MQRVETQGGQSRDASAEHADVITHDAAGSASSSRTATATASYNRWVSASPSTACASEVDPGCRAGRQPSAPISV